MARRSNLMELGYIPCRELDQLSAGKEGWLANDPTLLLALDANSLALANRSFVLVVDWNDSPPLSIRPPLSPSVEGEIAAIEWLIFDEFRVLALGTSNGFLLFYSTNADLIHKQIVHPSRIIRIRVRGSDDNVPQSTSSNEICIVMPGIIARFDGADIQNLLQRWSQDVQSYKWEDKVREKADDNYRRLPYQLWNVGKFGPCTDAAITGIMSPPLMELQSSQCYYCAITIGEDAVISAFRLSEDRNKSIIGVILSKVVPATFSTLSSVSKMIWRSNQVAEKPKEVKTQAFARASVLTCLKDPPRKGEKFALSPSGSLAAIADSLGRILLLDTQALVVVRQWKGYRDAHCLFMEMLVGGDASSSDLPQNGKSKSDYCLCLAIHAPRKSIVEVWKMRIGPRLLTVQCAKGSKILQPQPKLDSSVSDSSNSSAYMPLEVFLLNGVSGQLSLLRP
ncbi:unnamed protein product [Victoria cruziana]